MHIYQIRVFFIAFCEFHLEKNSIFYSNSLAILMILKQFYRVKGGLSLPDFQVRIQFMCNFCKVNSGIINVTHFKQIRYVLSHCEFCNLRQWVEDKHCQLEKYAHNGMTVKILVKVEKEFCSPYDMKKSGITNFFNQIYMLTFCPTI